MEQMAEQPVKKCSFNSLGKKVQLNSFFYLKYFFEIHMAGLF